MKLSKFTIFMWAVAGVTTFIVVSSIVRGLVVSKLWAWFVVPTFRGAPHLSIAAAIGIGMIVTFLTFQRPGRTREKSPEDKSELAGEMLAAVSVALVAPFVTLLIGYIVKGYM